MSAPWPLTSVVAVAVLQVVGLVVGGPLLLGLMRKTRCRLEGRAGPPIRQPLLDLRKLMRKERTRPEGASWMFSAAPLVLVGSVAVAAAITPLLATAPAFGPSADLFAVVFLLLLGSVALALGALDTGTAFGGMGASRAMTIGALSEPALLVAVLALSIPARSSNLPTIVSRSLAHPAWLASPQRLLAVVALVIVIVAECGRLPVDNPSTHLELTMIHEAMVLEYAGPDLALVKLAEAMRLGLLGRPARRPLRPLGDRDGSGPGAPRARARGGRRQGRRAGRGAGRGRGAHGQAPTLPGARADGWRLRPLGARRDLGGRRMSTQTFNSTLTFFCGAVLVGAVAVLWLSAVRAVVRVLAVQGLALGAVAATLGLHFHDAGLVATAVVVVAIKAVVIPALLRRIGSLDATERERRPLVNVPASLVVSAALILLAFASTHMLTHLVGGTAGSLVPVGFATLLVGFFVLVARRRPIFQIVGLLLVDNGIVLVAFLVTAGVPFLIELGVSFDVLLGVVVLMVLAQRLRHEFGDVDLDELAELHD